MVRIGPLSVTTGPMIHIEFERIEVLELLGMTIAHLNEAQSRGEISARVPVLLTIRDRLAEALRENL